MTLVPAGRRSVASLNPLGNVTTGGCAEQGRSRIGSGMMSRASPRFFLSYSPCHALFGSAPRNRRSRKWPRRQNAPRQAKTNLARPNRAYLSSNPFPSVPATMAGPPTGRSPSSREIPFDPEAGARRQPRWNRVRARAALFVRARPYARARTCRCHLWLLSARPTEQKGAIAQQS